MMPPYERTLQRVVAGLKPMAMQFIPCDRVGTYTVRRVARKVAKATGRKYVFLSEPNGLLVQRTE